MTTGEHLQRTHDAPCDLLPRLGWHDDLKVRMIRAIVEHLAPGRGHDETVMASLFAISDGQLHNTRQPGGFQVTRQPFEAVGFSVVGRDEWPEAPREWFEHGVVCERVSNK